MAGAIALNATSALACSCLAPGAPQDELAKSNSVLQGTVQGMRQIRTEGGYPLNLVEFTVQQSWKGLSNWHRKMVVRTSVGGASCGYDFKLGESYIVYASLSQDGELVTSICTRNNPTHKAAQDLAELGEGIRPR